MMNDIVIWREYGVNYHLLIQCPTCQQTVLIGEFSSQIVFNYKKEVPDVLESVEKDITRLFLIHVTHPHDIIPLPLSKNT